MRLPIWAGIGIDGREDWRAFWRSDIPIEDEDEDEDDGADDFQVSAVCRMVGGN